MDMRHQASTELISTFGIALVIIAVAIAVLLIFSSAPSQLLPTSCSIYGTVKCTDVAYGTNSLGVTTLVVLASSQTHGTINISSFSAVVGGVKSTSGYCSSNLQQGGSSVVLQGQSIYCTATFPNNATLSQIYTGTFSMAGNYCSGTTTCSGSTSPYSFTGSFTTRATPVSLTTTISTTLSSITSTTSTSSTSTPTTSPFTTGSTTISSNSTSTNSTNSTSTTSTILTCGNSVCQLIAGNGIALNPSNGIGVVTINVTPIVAPVFITPVQLFGDGPFGTYKTINLTSYVPAGAHGVILQALGGLDAPDCGDPYTTPSCSPRVLIRASPTSQPYTLLVLAASAGSDAWVRSNQGFFPISSNRTLQYEVTGLFNYGLKVSIIGYW